MKTLKMQTERQQASLVAMTTSRLLVLMGAGIIGSLCFTVLVLYPEVKNTTIISISNLALFELHLNKQHDKWFVEEATAPAPSDDVTTELTSMELVQSIDNYVKYMEGKDGYSDDEEETYNEDEDNHYDDDGELYTDEEEESNEDDDESIDNGRKTDDDKEGFYDDDAQFLDSIVNIKDGNPPALVWLMSFPLSGGGELEDLVSTKSGTAVAANSVGEKVFHKRLYPALGIGHRRGPWFWLDGDGEGNKDMALSQSNSHFLLTNTYCSGHCGNWCPPEHFLETAESFLHACAATTGLIPGDGVHGKWRLVNTHYSIDSVEKIVHLIDHPLANIVARFKDERHRHGLEFRQAYPESVVGFQRWCQSMDEYPAIIESERLLQSGFLNNPGVEQVPCLAEFIKYLQWHNLAFQVANKLDLPTMVVHRQALNGVNSLAAHTLLSFLELPNKETLQESSARRLRDLQEQQVVVGTGDNSYLAYFSEEQKDAIRAFLASAASDQTWQQLMLYDFD